MEISYPVLTDNQISSVNNNRKRTRTDHKQIEFNFQKEIYIQRRSLPLANVNMLCPIFRNLFKTKTIP